MQMHETRREEREVQRESRAARTMREDRDRSRCRRRSAHDHFPRQRQSVVHVQPLWSSSPHSHRSSANDEYFRVEVDDLRSEVEDLRAKLDLLSTPQVSRWASQEAARVAREPPDDEKLSQHAVPLTGRPGSLLLVRTKEPNGIPSAIIECSEGFGLSWQK